MFVLLAFNFHTFLLTIDDIVYIIPHSFIIFFFATSLIAALSGKAHLKISLINLLLLMVIQSHYPSSLWGAHSLLPE